MNQETNKMIAAAYQLYDVTDGANHLVEATANGKPFRFISGFGITLDAFEEALVNLNPGDAFDFTIAPDKAYGEYVDERIVDLDKDMFVIDGRFDDKHIHQDAIVPLQNEDGNHFLGRVLDITADKVRIDLNHPLAGKTLRFKGTVEESREATQEDIQQLYGDNGCEGCGGECGDDNCGGGCGGHGEGCKGSHGDGCKGGHHHDKGCHGKGCGHV